MRSTYLSFMVGGIGAFSWPVPEVSPRPLPFFIVVASLEPEPLLERIEKLEIFVIY